MGGIGWARGSGHFAEERGLRRGEWYQVLEDQGEGWLVLDVNDVHVRITRGHLLVRRSQPKTWSVVRLSPDQADGVHQMYLVCPSCHTRQHLAGRPKESECPKCLKTYPVDWSDRA
ncbi:MAG TPA: hypothetical protein VEU73_11655 [Gemmatimonadales bacterium]|nr:hypothetical protein [Gemmatimonadales bacterium]